MMQNLESQVALVTGGGSGLGECLCRMLAAAGASVVVADLRAAAAQGVAQKLQATGAQALGVELDVGDDRRAAEVVGHVLRQFGRLDVLVNNAGTDVTAPLEELSLDAFDRVVRTNLRGPFVMAKLAYAEMRERRRGQIVNIVSTAAKRTWPNASAYHASKWGLLGLSHALHVEGRSHGIKVTAVIAGGMRTPFILDRFPDTPLDVLQDPMNVAETVRLVLSQPAETVIPEIMVIPMGETSWP